MDGEAVPAREQKFSLMLREFGELACFLWHGRRQVGRAGGKRGGKNTEEIDVGRTEEIDDGED